MNCLSNGAPKANASNRCHYDVCVGWELVTNALRAPLPRVFQETATGHGESMVPNCHSIKVFIVDSFQYQEVTSGIKKKVVKLSDILCTFFNSSFFPMSTVWKSSFRMGRSLLRKRCLTIKLANHKVHCVSSASCLSSLHQTPRPTVQTAEVAAE